MLFTDLDNRIAEAKQKAANAGMPAREWTPEMVLRLWTKAGSREKSEAAKKCERCTPREG